MAQLDPLLQALVERNAEELILRDGGPPVFRSGSDLKPVSPKVLNQPQIAALLAELADQVEAAKIRAGQATSFDYRLADGAGFRCEVGTSEGCYAARVRAHTAETETAPAAAVEAPATQSAPAAAAPAPSVQAGDLPEIHR